MTNTDLLPSFSSIGPIRVSTERVDRHPAYGALLREARATGCCPVWLADIETLRPPDDPSAALATINHTDPAAVLAAHWPPNCPLCGCREPFGDVFPGLASAGVAAADPLDRAAGADQLHVGHLAVVAVERPADVITAIDWIGPCNYGRDLTQLSAVLRSWEERFGAIVVRIDRSTLWLSVAAPPRTLHDARAVAAEHFAFCCDVDREDPRPLRVYAAGLLGGRTWRFWWD
jgi:hypothetical protein